VNRILNALVQVVQTFASHKEMVVQAAVKAIAKLGELQFEPSILMVLRQGRMRVILVMLLIWFPFHEF